MTTTDQRSEALRLAAQDTRRWLDEKGLYEYADAISNLLKEHALQTAELRRLAEENERLKSQEWKIVGYGVFEDNNLHDFFFGLEEAGKMALYKGPHASVHPVFYLSQPAAPTQVETQGIPFRATMIFDDETRIVEGFISATSTPPMEPGQKEGS